MPANLAVSTAKARFWGYSGQQIFISSELMNSSLTDKCFIGQVVKSLADANYQKMMIILF
jgi:hypothetical protein